MTTQSIPAQDVEVKTRADDLLVTIDLTDQQLEALADPTLEAILGGRY